MGIIPFLNKPTYYYGKSDDRCPISGSVDQSATDRRQSCLSQTHLIFIDRFRRPKTLSTPKNHCRNSVCRRIHHHQMTVIVLNLCPVGYLIYGVIISWTRLLTQ